jgi:hypothetical protein
VQPVRCFPGRKIVNSAQTRQHLPRGLGSIPRLYAETRRIDSPARELVASRQGARATMIINVASAAIGMGPIAVQRLGLIFLVGASCTHRCGDACAGGADEPHHMHTGIKKDRLI